jgi:alpha,alpha-trehalase
MNTYTDKYQDCLAYIDSYWDKIISAPAKKKINRHIIDIPYFFVTPNDKKFRFIFYWDSYFISRGLLGTKREWLVKSMVENFLYLYEKYHFIPNFNALAAMGRSQPPFLTSMIMDAYAVLSRGKSPTQQLKNSLSKIFLKKGYANSWLEKTIEVAIREYANVWIDLQNNYHHRVKDFDLSRYGDRDLGYAHSSELESGWDFTSRFYNRCDEFLPIDLNVYLYKYEKDFAKASEILLNQDLVKDWNKKANLRKRLINKYMWNQKKGFFYDYNYRFQRQSDFLSLAGFTPMWAGLATAEQAKRMIKMLRHFETEYGLTITDSASLAPKMDLTKTPLRYRPAIEAILQPKQWDYPNIWPPLEYLTVIGLLRYGFIKEATRIMEKSLKTHARLFRKYGTFFEKIDGAKGDQSANYHYQAQTGFGWTNAVFYRYIQILDDLKASKSIFKTSGSKKPPYPLAIYH